MQDRQQTERNEKRGARVRQLMAELDTVKHEQLITEGASLSKLADALVDEAQRVRSSVGWNLDADVLELLADLNAITQKMLFALGEKAARRAAHAEQLKASIGQAELNGLADATLQILHDAGVAHYRKCAIAPVANKAGTWVSFTVTQVSSGATRHVTSVAEALTQAILLSATEQGR